MRPAPVAGSAIGRGFLRRRGSGSWQGRIRRRTDEEAGRESGCDRLRAALALRGGRAGRTRGRHHRKPEQPEPRRRTAGRPGPAPPIPARPKPRACSSPRRPAIRRSASPRSSSGMSRRRRHRSPGRQPEDGPRRPSGRASASIPQATPQCELAAARARARPPARPTRRSATASVTAARTCSAWSRPSRSRPPVYNLVPRQGEPARFGFSVARQSDVFLNAGVAWEGDYHEYFTIHASHSNWSPAATGAGPQKPPRLRRAAPADRPGGAFLTTPSTC